MPMRDIDIWLAYYNEINDERLLAQLRQLLTEEERQHEQRFYFADDRKRHLITRALVRTLLSHYEPAIAPEDWVFGANSYGRPEIANCVPAFARQSAPVRPGGSMATTWSSCSRTPTPGRRSCKSNSACETHLIDNRRDGRGPDMLFGGARGYESRVPELLASIRSQSNWWKVLGCRISARPVVVAVKKSRTRNGSRS
jgi:hypothetical protein